jgi:DNA-binding IclR family transcriptional regulator
LLGHFSDEEILAFIPAEDFRLPDGRCIDPRAFCREVRTATTSGSCVTRGLVDGFTTCMAAAVHGQRGVVLGCLCLVVPSAATNQDELHALLVDAARVLSQQAERCALPPPEAGGMVAEAAAAD